jgi:hypothetical protein
MNDRYIDYYFYNDDNDINIEFVVNHDMHAVAVAINEIFRCLKTNNHAPV